MSKSKVPELNLTEIEPEVRDLLDPSKAASAFNVDIDQGEYLPSMKIVTPIEMNNPSSPFDGVHVNKVVVTDGEAVEILEAPYKLHVIAARNASRQETRQDDGSVVYTRAYGEVRGFKRTAELYAEHMAKINTGAARFVGDEPGSTAYSNGQSYLIAVIKDGAVTIVQLDALKTASSYWAAALYPMTKPSAERMGAIITITDHKVNLVESSTPGRFYHGKKKFNQIKREPLTKEESELIGAAIAENSAKIKTWFNR